MVIGGDWSLTYYSVLSSEKVHQRGKNRKRLSERGVRCLVAPPPLLGSPREWEELGGYDHASDQKGCGVGVGLGEGVVSIGRD